MKKTKEDFLDEPGYLPLKVKRWEEYKENCEREEYEQKKHERREWRLKKLIIISAVVIIVIIPVALRLLGWA